MSTESGLAPPRSHCYVVWRAMVPLPVLLLALLLWLLLWPPPPNNFEKGGSVDKQDDRLSVDKPTVGHHTTDDMTGAVRSLARCLWRRMAATTVPASSSALAFMKSTHGP